MLVVFFFVFRLNSGRHPKKLYPIQLRDDKPPSLKIIIRHRSRFSGINDRTPRKGYVLPSISVRPWVHMFP